MYEMPAEGMLCAVGANIVGIRMVTEVLTARECVTVLSLITDTVVAPTAMRSVFDAVDVEVWVSAGCGVVLSGVPFCDMSCGSQIEQRRSAKIPWSIFALCSPAFRSIRAM